MIPVMTPDPWTVSLDIWAPACRGRPSCRRWRVWRRWPRCPGGCCQWGTADTWPPPSPAAAGHRQIPGRPRSPESAPESLGLLKYRFQINRNSSAIVLSSNVSRFSIVFGDNNRRLQGVQIKKPLLMGCSQIYFLGHPVLFKDQTDKKILIFMYPPKKY